MSDNDTFSFRWGIPKEYDFTNIPNFILFNYPDLGITTSQMMLIIHLASFRYESEKTQGARPSIQTIAERMDLTYSHTHEIIKTLEGNGWLIITPIPGKPSIYDFAPLTQACLELQQSKGVSGKSETYPSGKSERGGSQENLRRRIELDQEEKKRKEVESPSPFFPDSPSPQKPQGPTRAKNAHVQDTPTPPVAPVPPSPPTPTDVYDTPPLATCHCGYA